MTIFYSPSSFSNAMYVQISLLCGLLLLCSVAAAQQDSTQLAAIQSRGILIVGVKTDYPPWGFYDANGNIVGIEADLAKDIADRLGVTLRLQGVSASNRINKLQGGSVDLLIATMGDTAQRRQQTGIIAPSYYSSGAAIIIPKETPLHSWSELYGRSVCLTKNAYFNREIIERFLLKPQFYEGTLDNLAALKYGRCMGWLYDDTALNKLLQEPQWQSFEMPLQTIMVNPWAVAVRLGEENTAYGLLVSDAIIDWHRTGKLLDLEKKWGVRNSQFLIEANARWNEKNQQDEYVCQRLPNNTLPLSCLSRQSIGAASANENNVLAQWGINFPPIYDDYSRAGLVKGVGLTLLLSVLAIIGSLLFGALMGVLLYRLPRVFSWAIGCVNDVFRMTPPLLNLYIVFFGLGGLVALHYGIQFNAIVVAVIVLSLYAGSSNGVLIYQALKHMAKRDQQDHCESIRLLFPQAFKHAYEGINANSVNIVKAVGLASMIAVPELISSSNSIIAEYGNQSEMMTFLLLFYFLIVYLFIFFLDRLKQYIHPDLPSTVKQGVPVVSELAVNELTDSTSVSSEVNTRE